MGVCKCSGKYIDIYFILKITYPISTLPEHLHSTIPNSHLDGGMCSYKQMGVAEQGTGTQDDTDTTTGVDAIAKTQEECRGPTGPVSKSGRSKQTPVRGIS